jgi:guanosine-3',5'-bis(diphosphate) 3'-pyrophosphohydrolase
MIRFDDIAEKVQKYNPQADMALLRRAYVYSAKEHKGQVRLSGEPYLTHPLGVSMILAEMKLDTTSVAVGLLHDIIEDTLASKKDIEQYFGKEVAHLVEQVTKLGQISYTSREERQAEYFRKMLLAMAEDIRVILLKIADRLHNMRTLKHVSRKQQVRIARETLEIYVPLANRLGLGKIQSELQDLGFRYLNPELYNDLADRIEKERSVSVNFIKKIENILENDFKENKILARVEGRIKSIYSLYKKMMNQNLSLSEVYDYIAFRIVTRSTAQCYAALGIIHNLWSPVPGRIKDYIAMPKPNGYQSLHTTVITKEGNVFEVQIRTEEMHLLAEEGIAAHWRYKEGRPGKEQDEVNLAWLRRMVEWQQDVSDPHEFMESFKIDLFPDEVYCFTPKGDVMVFPKKATVIDFAYAIHTDVGHNCVGARINRKMVPIKTQLKNGDKVEIITSANQHPSRDWLKIVKTTKAKNKIRQWLNKYELGQREDIGKKLLSKELRKKNSNLSSFIKNNRLSKAAEELGCNKEEDLYSAIAMGQISTNQVIAKLLPEEKQQEKQQGKSPSLPQRISQSIQKAISPGHVIKVKGYDDFLFYIARCCNPLPGEEIVGYITRGKGIAIHSVNCPNVKRLLYQPEREIEVMWDLDKDMLYPAKISIHFVDRPGLMADITAKIAEAKLNIRDIQSKAYNNKRAIAHLVLDINNIKQLDRIIKSLKKIDGIYEVERV